MLGLCHFGNFKIIEKNLDSLNINYLLNCIENSPDNYPFVKKKDLLEQITQHRKELNQVDTLLPGLDQERNRVIAHLDKKLVNNPEIVFPHPRLEMDNLYKAFQILRGILDLYNKQTESLSLWADESNTIRDELENIISLINKLMVRSYFDEI